MQSPVAKCNLLQVQRSAHVSSTDPLVYKKFSNVRYKFASSFKKNVICLDVQFGWNTLPTHLRTFAISNAFNCYFYNFIFIVAETIHTRSLMTWCHIKAKIRDNKWHYEMLPKLIVVCYSKLIRGLGEGRLLEMWVCGSSQPFERFCMPSSQIRRSTRNQQSVDKFGVTKK